jgi:hypothetical protein
VSINSGLAYSCGLRAVPLAEYSVTNTTARWKGASPSESVWSAGGAGGKQACLSGRERLGSAHEDADSRGSANATRPAHR